MNGNARPVERFAPALLEDVQITSRLNCTGSDEENPAGGDVALVI